MVVLPIRTELAKAFYYALRCDPAMAGVNMSKIIEDGKGPGLTIILIGMAVAVGAGAFFLRSSEEPQKNEAAVVKTEIEFLELPEKRPEPAKPEKPYQKFKLGDGSYETTTGLRYIDIRVGTGEIPPKGSLVKVHYTGTWWHKIRQFSRQRTAVRIYPWCRTGNQRLG